MEIASESEKKFQAEVTEDQYDTARTEQIGWCPLCEDFTTAGVGPTEVGAVCGECVEPVVVGALHALRGGFIYVEVVS